MKTIIIDCECMKSVFYNIMSVSKAYILYAAEAWMQWAGGYDLEIVVQCILGYPNSSVQHFRSMCSDIKAILFSNNAKLRLLEYCVHLHCKEYNYSVHACIRYAKSASAYACINTTFPYHIHLLPMKRINIQLCTYIHSYMTL